MTKDEQLQVFKRCVIDLEPNGKAFKGLCPKCKHHALIIDDNRGDWLGWCGACTQGYNAYDLPDAPPVSSDSAKQSKPKNEEYTPVPITPPWNQWTNPTDKTYDLIRQARATRKSYMPRLDTLRTLGVRETTSAHNAPHNPWGFPYTLGPTVPKTTAEVMAAVREHRFAEIEQPQVDNLLVLRDATKKSQRPWTQMGPNPKGQQDLVFGLLRNGVNTFQMLDELWLTEGPWDAAALIELGFTAWSIMMARQKDLHPYIWRMLTQTRRVNIIRDNDRGQEISFCNLVGKFDGVYTRIIELPEVKDVCELRHKYTDPTFCKHILMDAARDGIELQPRRVEILESKQPESPADKDMPEEVLDGYLGELVAKRMTAFSRAYSWPTVVTVAGLYSKGSQTNLFTGLIGPAHSGKSDAYTHAKQLLSFRDSDARIMEKRFGSFEGFAKHYGRASGAPRLYWPDELSYLMDKAQIEGSSWASALTTLFYKHDEYEVTIAKKEKVAVHMKLSLLGGVVEENFDDVFMNKTSNGLYDRFLFGVCPEGYQYLYRPFAGEGITVDEAGSGDCDFGIAPPQTSSEPLDGRRLVNVSVNPEVWDARDEWFHKLGINPRVAEICLRVARICAAWDGRSTLQAADLGPTLALCKYQMAVREKYSPNRGVNTGGVITQKVLKYAKQHGSNGEWMEERVMARRSNLYDLGADAVERLLLAMQRSLLIDRKEESGGGRPKRYFRLLVNPDEV